VGLGVVSAALAPTPAATTPQEPVTTMLDPKAQNPFDDYPSDPLPDWMPPKVSTFYTTMPDGTILEAGPGEPEPTYDDGPFINHGEIEIVD